MKVVLLENVKKLGKKDEIVDVSDGYARNVLIPKKQALLATTENLNNLKLKNKNEEKKDENLRKIANENKTLLESDTIVINIKAGANGKTFGSITSKEVSEAIFNKTNLDISKKDIVLDDTIKNIGVYNVKAKLYKDIFATVKIEVREA